MIQYIILSILLLACSGTPSTKFPRQSETLYFGHSSIDVNYLVDHIEEIKESTSQAVYVTIDGASNYYPRATGENLSWNIFKGKLISTEHYQKASIKLRQIQTNLTNLYYPIQFFVGIGNFDWTDESLWNITRTNLVNLSKFLREAKYAGVILEPEEYGNGPNAVLPELSGNNAFWTWSYKGYPNYHPRLDAFYPDRDYEFIRKIVRARGREVGFILSDLRIFLSFGYSHVDWVTSTDRSETCLGLYAEFLDGMLEGSSARTEFIDLSEGNFTSDRWDEAGRRVISEVEKYTTVNPKLWRSKMSIGYGIFSNHYTQEDLEIEVENARKKSSELNGGVSYVWVYNEDTK